LTLPSSPNLLLDVSVLPTVIVLASGRGERFTASGGQGSKLAALIDGKTVLQWTLDAVKATGLPWHLEDAGHPGMGDSIAAAVRATPHAHGWLILPADLPLISAQTIRKVADALERGAQAAHPTHEGERGHPVGFAASNQYSLQNLKGNQGAAGILSALSATEIIVDDLGCITDVDTLEQLERVRIFEASQSKKPA
jgi:molybdenum cofactor cytidylyltransferase